MLYISIWIICVILAYPLVKTDTLRVIPKYRWTNADRLIALLLSSIGGPLIILVLSVFIIYDLFVGKMSKSLGEWLDKDAKW